MHGTLVNVATVAAGTAVGRLGGAWLPERHRRMVTTCLGLFTVALGISSAMAVFTRGRLAEAVVLLVGLVVGGLAGTAADIEGRIERLGERLRARTGSGEGSFARGFLIASVLFCVGPLTIVGSLEDGVSGDASLIVIKAVMDGFAAVALASVYGTGVGASVLTILVVQGGLTMGAGALSPMFTPDVLRGLDAVGGVVVTGIGLRLLEIRDIPTGDLLPALALVPAGFALL